MAAIAFLAPIAMIPASDLGGGAPIVGVTRKDVSNMGMTCQEEDEWCWAAVTQTVEGWKGQTLDQSHIASHHVDPTSAGLACAHPLATGDSGSKCAGCGGQGCSEPHSLSVVLTERGRISAIGAVNKLPQFSDIKAAVDADKPLPVRIAWDEDNAHFICVAGYSIDGTRDPFVTIYDPLVPGVGAGDADEQDVRYSTFSTAYTSTGGASGVPDYFYELR